MNDQIIELLENTELRQKVISVIKEVWSYAGTLYDNAEEHIEHYENYTDESSLWEEAWWRAESSARVVEIEEVFDKYVIQKMAKPYRLTLQELFEAFLDLAKPDESHVYEFERFDSDDCNNLYMVFVTYVMNHIVSHRYSDPFPICMVTDKEEGELLLQGFLLGYQHAKGEKWQPPDLSEDTTVWDKNGVSVRLLRGADVIKERPGGKKLYHLRAIIEGEMSTSACSMLQNEMSRILPTAIRSADLLQTERWGQYKVIGQIEPRTPSLYNREISGLPWGQEKLIENAKPLIRQYLDAYYSEPSKKDSINRRIHNAIRLLIESDNQPNDAVGLALSITAIEALLGEKGKEATLRLADNVGTLLEPDLNQRSNAAEFVTDLYDARSDALHGRAVETESETRIYAPHLAAATLSGAIDLMNSVRSLGDEPKTRQELLQKLRERRFQSGQPLGVKEYNVRTLWRNRTTGKKNSIL